MRYPELPILPDHLSKIAAIERFAGSWHSASRLNESQRAELKAGTLIDSTAALLRLEGRGTDRDVVDRTLRSLEQHELDFSRHSEEILGLHSALETFTAGELEVRDLFDPAVLMEIHGAVLEEVPTLRQSRGQLRDAPLVVQAFDAAGVAVGDVFAAPDVAEVSAALAQAFSDARDENDDKRWHPLLVISWLCVRLITIQPFTNGSFRSVHILCEMLLRSEGYGHGAFQSLPAIMEEEAGPYFVAARNFQRTASTTQEGLSSWHSFFLGCLVKQAARVRARQRLDDTLDSLPPLSEEIIRCVRDRGKLTLRDASESTGANRNTVKLHLKKLVDAGSLVRNGTGKGTWYSLP